MVLLQVPQVQRFQSRATVSFLLQLEPWLLVPHSRLNDIILYWGSNLFIPLNLLFSRSVIPQILFFYLSELCLPASLYLCIKFPVGIYLDLSFYPQFHSFLIPPYLLISSSTKKKKNIFLAVFIKYLLHCNMKQNTVFLFKAYIKLHFYVGFDWFLLLPLVLWVSRFG